MNGDGSIDCGIMGDFNAKFLGGAGSSISCVEHVRILQYTSRTLSCYSLDLFSFLFRTVGTVRRRVFFFLRRSPIRFNLMNIAFLTR